MLAAQTTWRAVDTVITCDTTIRLRALRILIINISFLVSDDIAFKGEIANGSRGHKGIHLMLENEAQR